ncbi:MAG TPA: EAL domain-containing protein [Hyphomicrobiaceae bacterium]|nr:EAL domain-containing protein [Hyphomicrobiaceae bacterium]
MFSGFVAFWRRIAGRLYCAGGLALLAIAALAAASIYCANLTSQATEKLYDDALVGVVDATEIDLLLERHRRTIETAAFQSSRFQVKRDRRLADAFLARIEDLAASSGDALAKSIATLLPALSEEARKVLMYAESSAREKADEAVGAYVQIADELQDRIRAYRSARTRVASEKVSELLNMGRLLSMSVAIAAGVALILIGPLSLLLVRSIVVRLKTVTGAMQKIASNDTSVTLDTTGPDEISDMARAVDVFKSNAITLLDHKSKLEQLNFWLDVALNNMTRGLSLFDGEQRLVVSNALYQQMYELPSELVAPGTPFARIMQHRIPLIGAMEGEKVANEVLTENFNRLVESGCSESFSQQMMDGRTIQVCVQPLADGGWVALHEDVTEQRRAQAEIARLARHDMLTGLGNRLLFREELEKACKNLEFGYSFALVCIDLDHFKDVNDTLGHPTGDALLQAVAARLTDTARGRDAVVRLGGDEFAIIQAGADTRPQVEGLTQRVIKSIAQPFQIHGHKIIIGATVGAALAPVDGSDPDQLLKYADMALYRAKAAGRGTHAFFEPEMAGRIKSRRMLELDLRRALAENQLDLHYQPIIDLATERIVSCEALMRWRHPERGMVSPVDFIALAEEMGLIMQMGQWALQTACTAATAWPSDVKVAVNLSAVQFKGADLVGMVIKALEMSGLSAERLELEVTESLLLEQDPKTLQLLHLLQHLGVRIALDDFGTGYSSLSYLRGFPFDKIKIDQTFVRDLTQREDCMAIVTAVAQLAKSLQMTTVAEGVETPEHLAKVRAAGCTQVQGYLFSRPVSASEIVGVIEDCNRRLKTAA